MPSTARWSAPSANRSGRPSLTRFADAHGGAGAASPPWASTAATARWGWGPPSSPASTARRACCGPAAWNARPSKAVVGPLAEAETDAKRSPGASPCTTPPTRRCASTPDTPRPRRGLSGLRSRARRALVYQSQPCGRPARSQPPTYSPSCAKPTALRSAAIAVAPIPADGLGEAINDRLKRAARFAAAGPHLPFNYTGSAGEQPAATGPSARPPSRPG